MGNRPAIRLLLILSETINPIKSILLIKPTIAQCPIFVHAQAIRGWMGAGRDGTGPDMTGAANKAYQRSENEQALEGVDLGVLASSLGPVVRLLRNHLASRIMLAFEPYGLRTGSFSTMALIAANPGCSQSEIARETGVDKSVVVAVVDLLEERGLAERTRSTEDRRRNALTLTEAGHARLIEMHELALSIEAPIRAALSEEEVATLIHLNRKALQALVASDQG
jgi:DNA-binding MarR family transcriptional regulator